MTQLTPTGIIVTSLDERVQQYDYNFKLIYGQDIDTDPSTPDGQLIGLFAQAVASNDQLLSAVLNQFNPQTAVGAHLSRIVAYNGITRQAGSYSSVSLRAVGTVGTIIPAGSAVGSSVTADVFVTQSEAIIGVTGFANIPAIATEFGPVSAPANTLTEIRTPVFGWQSVTNLAAAAQGTYEETDEELRIRRRQSTSITAVGPMDALVGIVKSVTGVTRARVYENFTATTNANGQPAHSIYAVVEGGANADVAAAIWARRGQGTTMVGSVSVPIVNANEETVNVLFDRPIDVPITVNVTIKALSNFPTDGVDRIKQAVVDWSNGKTDGSWNVDIGADVFVNPISCPINTVQGQYIVTLTASRDSDPASASLVAIAYNELARYAVDDINVTVT